MAEVDPVQIEAVINRLSDAMSRLLIDEYHRHLAELDLTFLQAQALRILRRGASTPGSLAAELRVTAPAITQLIDRLARKNLVARRAAEGDRRAIVVALSPKGKRLVDAFRRRRGAVFTRALERMNEAERRDVMGVLERLIESLEDTDERFAIEPPEAKQESTGSSKTFIKNDKEQRK